MLSLRDDPHGERLSRWLLAIGLLAAGWAAAETYLILSLIGDRFTVITAEQQIGSNLDRNVSRVASIAGSALDDFAVRAADATIARARPDVSVTMLRTRDPALYALGESLADADVADVHGLLTQLDGAFAGAADPRLLLIAPLRAEPDLRTDRVMSAAARLPGSASTSIRTSRCDRRGQMRSDADSSAFSRTSRS